MLIVYSTDKLEKLSTAIVPKKIELAAPIGMFSSLHINGDKLYYVSAHLRPLLTAAVAGIFDLATLKMIKMDIVDKKEIDNTDPADPKATLWFKDSYAIPYIKGKGGLRIKRVETSLQKFSY